MILFLDDIRNIEDVKWVNYPDDGHSTVRSYKEFIQYIEQEGLPDLISFDHDLSLESAAGQIIDEKTGYDCAKWLINYCYNKDLDLPAYIIHSMNPVGKQNIINILESYKNYEQ